MMLGAEEVIGLRYGLHACTVEGGCIFFLLDITLTALDDARTKVIT